MYRYVYLCLLMTCVTSAFGSVVIDFEETDDLVGWSLTGNVYLDTRHDHTHEGGGKSLCVIPGAKAVWQLRDKDASGTVDLWFYEDGTKRESPKVRGGGPHVGIVTEDGTVLTVGAIYAPYLNGNGTYAASEYKPETRQPWAKVTYLGTKRTVGWHHWTFRFDPTSGLELLYNGEVNKRYNWSKSDVRGFTGVVVIGDLNEDHPQTAWIDDVTVTLGEDMQVTPGGVNELTGIIPEQDPKVLEDVPGIVPSLAGQHPRLLFSAADLNDLQAFRQTPDGKRFWKFVENYRNSALDPGNLKFQTDATDAQRKGLWRMPTKALYYALTGDTRCREDLMTYLDFLHGLQHWETGSETDAGMGAANMMVGAALAFDVLYHDLKPTKRETLRQKLWLHARRMYYGGHKKYLDNTHYWQADPQNNHRWHRNAGLTLCVLAAWTGAEEEKWLMRELRQELAYMSRWLPQDGTSHEGPGYLVFGGVHLTLALDVADRCLGTTHLHEPFFENCSRYLIQTHLPGYQHWFNYGDQSSIEAEKWGYHVFQLKGASVFGDPDTVAMLDRLMDQHSVDSVTAWAGFLWYPRNVAKGIAGNLPKVSFFEDLGLYYLRSSWEADGQAAMFKCGPLGGYTLNRFRVQNGMSYINVAHDDPDMNTFTLFSKGAYIAETDRYSFKKKTAALNGILINGLGAVAAGRQEGGKWTQPATGGRDMTTMGVITAYAENETAVAIEGEAAGAYAAHKQSGKSRPAMERMRRIFLWIPNRYVLILDDIRAPQAVDMTWLLQGHQLEIVDRLSGQYRLVNDEIVCPMQVQAEHPTQVLVTTSPAENRGTVLGWQQLQLKVEQVNATRFASVYDLWQRGNMTVSLQVQNVNQATVTVMGSNFQDTWTWQAAKEPLGPSTVQGQRQDGSEIILMQDPEPQTQALIAESK